MTEQVPRRWHQLGAWHRRQRARRQELRQRRREQQRAVWGGPVEADRGGALTVEQRDAPNGSCGACTVSGARWRPGSGRGRVG